MKNVGKILAMVIALVFMGCQKEELPPQQENAVSNKKAAHLLLGLSTKKPLKAHLVAKETSFAARHGHTSLVFQDKMWVIGGRGFESSSAFNLNDTWSSYDGLNWAEMTDEGQFKGRFNHASTVFDDKIWVVGGRTSVYSADSSELNDVWASKDGIEWAQITSNASFAPRYYHTLTAFNGSLWVIGGSSETAWEIWRSFNGKDWFLVTDYPPFSWRRGHAVTVFDGKLWLIGGRSNDGFKNDIWYTSDGYSWTEATSEAAFSKRWMHGLSVHDGRMWLTAGAHLFEYYNDVWSSDDGIAWKQHKTTEMFPARQDHSTVAYKDRLWIINGLGLTWPSPNGFWPFLHTDVWSINVPEN